MDARRLSLCCIQKTNVLFTIKSHGLSRKSYLYTKTLAPYGAGVFVCHWLRERNVDC